MKFGRNTGEGSQETLHMHRTSRYKCGKWPTAMIDLTRRHLPALLTQVPHLILRADSNYLHFDSNDHRNKLLIQFL